MWKAKNRQRRGRRSLHDPSNQTDAESAVVAPLIAPAKRSDRRRGVNVRQVTSGLLDVLESGRPRWHLPKDPPPQSTAYDDVVLWGWDGTRQRINGELYARLRQPEGREPAPSAAIVDRQSVRPGK